MKAEAKKNQLGKYLPVVLVAVAFFGTHCSLKESDTATIKGSTSLLLTDGQSISQADSDDYNPYLQKLSDGTLVVVFGSNRSCSGCTAGKHHLFIARSSGTYSDNGVLPAFNSPAPLTVLSAETAWDYPISFAVTRTTTALRIFLNNTSGNIVYADLTSGTDVTALSDINNSTWKSQTVVGVTASGDKIFARNSQGQIYLFDPSASDSTLTPMGSSQGTNSIAHLNPMYSMRPDAFFTVQGNQIQSAAYMMMGGGVPGLNIALGNARVWVRSVSILYSANKQGELVLMSGSPEGGGPQDLYVVEGATPSLLWDQTFPKPGDQNFNSGAVATGNYKTFQAANLVLGSANFTSQGTAGTFDIVDMEAKNGILFLSQKTGSKLHVFNVIPAINNAPASLLLTGYNGGVALDNGIMVRTNNTTISADLSFFVPVPTVGGAFPAANYSQGTTGATCTQSEFGNTTEQLAAGAGKLIVPDKANHRVMVWNAMPLSGVQMANIVLGQPNFTTCTATTTATGLNAPGKPWTNGQKLVVADTGNNRVLIWNTFPTTNGQAPDIVLGQPGFVTGTANNGGVSASSLSSPNAVASDGNRLAVVDTGNNRVLIWNTFPTANNQPANGVLGQNDFVHVTANDDNQDNVDDNASAPASGRVMKNPRTLFMTPNAILVSDFTHERVLIFMAPPQ